MAFHRIPWLVDYSGQQVRVNIGQVKAVETRIADGCGANATRLSHAQTDQHAGI